MTRAIAQYGLLVLAICLLIALWACAAAGQTITQDDINLARQLGVRPEPHMRAMLNDIIATLKRTDEALGKIEAKAAAQKTRIVAQAEAAKYHVVVEFVQDKCPLCGAMKPEVAQAKKKGWDIRTVNIDDPLVSGTTVSGREMVNMWFDKVGVPQNQRKTPAFFVAVKATRGFTSPKLLTVGPGRLESVLSREGVAKK